MTVSRLRVTLCACLLAGTALAQQQITVAPKDTLWSLSRKYNTTVEELMAANSLAGDALSVGMTLSLPAGAAQAAPAQAAPAAAETAEAVSSFPDAATYTVQAGDSLFAIASAYGFSLEDFMALNGLRSDVINPGQILKTRRVHADRFVALVQPGDNLQRIADRHGISATQLAAANSIALHSVLNPGHELVIPSSDFVVTGELAALPDIGGVAGPTITVQPGDNLWSIARTHGMQVEELKRINGLNGDSLRPGQSLQLMPGAVPTTPSPNAHGTQEMIWPATGIITSHFGWRSLRIGGTNMHYGLDLDGNTGDPILSATAGVVTFSGWRGGYGNLVIVEADGVEYYYAHASELLVSVGTIVAPGTLLARIGTTGNVTGAHLHFEIRVNGSPVDPLPILEARAGRR